MANLIDYLYWRGDLSFDERGFNEVDNLILSELVYFDFDRLLPLTGSGTPTLGEIYDAFQRADIPYTEFDNGALSVLAACAGCSRYSSVRVQSFRRITDEERQLQFAAAAFLFPDYSVYIAFRGTDDSIVGWREDFNLSFMQSTAAQDEAVKFLDEFLAGYAGSVTVGGHSKGGNLAVYAAAFCKYTDRIDLVFSNDGPGFNQYITQREEYKAILPKVRLIIPEDSMIGIIMSNTDSKEVIRSDAEGVQQHDPLTWLVERDSFVKAQQQSSGSLLLDATLKKWLESMSLEEREKFFTSVFDIIDETGAKTLSEINANKWLSYNSILKAVTAQSEEIKDTIFDTLKKLALAGRDAIWDETQKRFIPHRFSKED